MKKIISAVLAVVLLCAVVCPLAGCKKKDAALTVYLGDRLYDLDPANAVVSDEAAQVLSLIYEPLFRLTESGSVKNGLAKSWKKIENPEKGEYGMEIVLRESYWSGSKLTQITAADVYYAWMRILDPRFESQAAPLLYDIKNAVAVKQGEKSVNDLGIEENHDTLTITFEGPVDYDAFLRNLTSVALSPLLEKAVTKGATEDDTPGFWAKKSSYIACSGPFTVRTINYDTGEFTLERNPGYKVASVKPASLIAGWWYPDAETEDGEVLEYGDEFLEAKLDEFLDGTVFVLGAMPLGEDGVRADYKKKADTTDLLSTYSYIFNTNKEIFKDARVRQALSLAIDRDAIAEMLVYAKAADGFIANGVWEAGSAKTSFREKADALIATSANVAEAEKLLAAAEGDGVDLGERIVISYRDSVDEAFVAETVAEVWNELGLNVTTKALTYDETVWTNAAKWSSDKPGRPVWMSGSSKSEAYKKAGNGTPEGDMYVYDDGIQALYADGEFDVLAVDYQMYSVNAFTALCGFTSDMNGNGVSYGMDAEGLSTYSLKTHCSGFVNEAYDKLLRDALAEKDLEKRAAILHEAEALLIEQMPVMPICYNVGYTLTSGVGGISTDAYGLLNFTKVKA